MSPRVTVKSRTRLCPSHAAIQGLPQPTGLPGHPYWCPACKETWSFPLGLGGIFVAAGVLMLAVYILADAEWAFTAAVVMFAGWTVVATVTTVRDYLEIRRTRRDSRDGAA